MPKPLGEIERRVVGVLLEKLLATPQNYPLTHNSLVAGCNQKNNRDPVMDLSDEVVERTLRALQHDHQPPLTISVFAEGARTEKFRTAARDVYNLGSEKAMAIFAELLLRGPQTKSELRSRGSRMRHEISAEEVDQILAEWAGRPEPLAQNLGRAPGGRAERWAHTLYDERELAALKAASIPAHAFPMAQASVPHPDTVVASAPAPFPPVPSASAEKLEDALREIAALKERVEALENAMAEVRGH
jgi:uncharacterized protein YceH (UPF0502 family)